MNTKGRARELRADGRDFGQISEELGIGLQWAYKCAGDIEPAGPQETDETVVRHHAYNGGCSTTSGMMPISMPRITTIHGAAQ
jgi:hypothetical protein